MFFKLPSILTVPLTAFILLVLVGAGPASNVFSQSFNHGGINIDLLAASSPRFFECDVTPVNGTSSVNGLNPEESAQNILTDGNLDTAIMGDARFDVHFNEPITNHPGPEIKVVELSGVERFNVSVGSSNMTENSIIVTPQFINQTNGCNYSINEALIDLQNLGITPGSSVSSISFDNLGDADSLLGSDIAEINIIDNQTNGNTSTIDNQTNGNTSTIDNQTNGNTSTIDNQAIYLGGKSLPENDYIHLYDSTPYHIVNGHITANLPCNEDNSTDVNLLVGQAPNLAPAQLQLISPPSTDDGLCTYGIDIASNDAATITDIAIQNNSTDDIDLPETSSVGLSFELAQ